MSGPRPEATVELAVPIRLCIVVNPAFALLTCYAEQYGFLQARGFVITAVSGAGEKEHAAARALGVSTHVVPMERYARPWRDLRSLWDLWRFFRSRRFDVVQVSTPKASLLGVVAARLAGQRGLMYLVRGRAYECLHGPRRWALARLDALCCRLSDVVVPVSPSLAEALVWERVCPPARLRTVGNGSSQGVDLAAFAPTAEREAVACRLRQELGVPAGGALVLFVGWLRREKGIVELVEAMRRVRVERSWAHLLALGDPHEPDDVPGETWQTLRGGDGFHWRRWTADTAPFYHAADVVVLPSWREGLPRVVLEAGAAGRPVVATDVTGCRDAVRPDVTGLLVPPRDPAALATAIGALLDDAGWRAELGARAAAHVAGRYDRKAVWAGMAELMGDLALRTPD